VLKNGLAALLIGLFVFSATPATATAPNQACAVIGSDCCCDSCPCPVKGGESCVSCVPEKINLAVVASQPVAKQQIRVALYLLPANKPVNVSSFLARSIRGLDPSPPSDGSAHQALLRLWLI